jgi:FixJ family two-component response regulator
MTGRLRERSAAISVVDDDESILDSTRQLLRSAGHRVSTFASAEEFLNSGSVESSACVVLDVKMPGIDGLDLQRRLIDSGATVPIVFISAHDDARTRERAIRAGALDFLKKPFDAGRLLATIETALGWQATRSAAHILHFGIDDRYRIMVLRSAGYLVQDCSSPKELLRLSESEIHRDLICVSEDPELPPLEVLAIAREKCNALVVLFRNTSQAYPFHFDLEIENLSPPAVWLSDIRRILAAPMELHSMRKQ